jgi:hypothetical protein
MRNNWRWILVAILLVVMGGLSALPPSASEAGTAPDLKRVQVVKIWSEHTPAVYVPENHPNRMPDGVVFKGRTLYVQVRFDGYPNWNAVNYHCGSAEGMVLPNHQTALTMLGKHPVYGYLQTVAIPFESFSTNQADIFVTAQGRTGRMLQTMVTGIQLNFVSGK